MALWTKLSSGSWGGRIGLKVFLAFILVIVIMVMVAVAAWLAFSHVSERMGSISDRQIPVISASARFAELGGQLTSTAPRLLSSVSSWERDSVWSELEHQLEQLDELLLSKNAPYSLPPEIRTRVVSLLPEIRANLYSLNENMVLIFDSGRRNRVLSESLRWTHATFLDEIDPILEDSRFNIDLIMRRLSEPEGLKIPAENLLLLQQRYKTRELLMRVNADSNLAVGLILRGASQQTLADINHTMQFFGEVEDRLRDNVIQLPRQESTLSLRQAIETILSFASAKNNLTEVKKQEILLSEKNQQRLNENKKLIRLLKDLINDQLNFAEQAAQQAAENAKKSVSQGRSLLLIMLVAGFVVAFVVGRLYVGRNLLGRLNTLRSSMAAIAEGNLEVNIDVRGSDEITQMAKALIVFRNTAIEVEEANAQSIIDNALVGLISTDENGHIEFLNSNARQLFGISADYTGLPFVETFIATSQRQQVCLKELAAQPESQMICETHGLNNQAQNFPLDLTVRTYQRRHQQKYLLTLVDATERREAKSLLEDRIALRTQDLEVVNQKLRSEVIERQRTEAELRATHQELVQTTKLATLGELSAGIAHELNQPLSAIRYNAHNALQLLKHNRLTDSEGCLQKIENLTDKMAQIINHLKIFSRRAADETSPVDLVEVINSALSLFSQRIDRLKSGLIWRHQPGSVPLVQGDPVRLEQVIVNLIGNSLDAMSDSASPRLKLQIIPDGTLVCLSISDNGSGMSEETIKQMFDPFFTTKKAGEGLGLGLSISDKIIRELGGEFRVSSTPNVGTTVDLALKQVDSDEDKASLNSNETIDLYSKE